jgi:hypothetical protein
MSGLNRTTPTDPGPVRQHTRIEGLIDPTVELTQPGGPFPYGEALLTDGAGGYTIAPTLRPYLITFRYSKSTGIAPGTAAYCDHQGVLTDLLGIPIPFAANIIGVGVALSHPTEAAQTFLVEIFQIMDHANVVFATLEIGSNVRRSFRRDLSVALASGAELGARIRHTAGAGSSFTKGIVSVELEG